MTGRYQTMFESTNGTMIGEPGSPRRYLVSAAIAFVVISILAPVAFFVAPLVEETFSHSSAVTFMYSILLAVTVVVLFIVARAGYYRDGFLVSQLLPVAVGTAMVAYAHFGETLKGGPITVFALGIYGVAVVAGTAAYLLGMAFGSLPESRGE